MNLFRKLALGGIGLAFVLGLAVTESNAQRSGRYNGNRGYVRSGPSFSISINSGRSYGRRYNNYYGGRRSYGRSYYNNAYYGGRSYNRGGGYGLSWRERRILAIR